MIAVLGGCAGALNLPQTHRPQSFQVRRGDTLYSIAWHYGLDYHTVARWNGISRPYVIHPGQRIALYPPGGAPARAVQRTYKTNVASAYKPAAKPVERTTTAGAPSPQPAARQAVQAPAYTAPANAAAPVAGGPINWQWPASGAVVHTFGQSDLSGKGIVINGHLGSPVLASADGTVVYSGNALVGYGNLVIVKHNDEWLSAYGQNQQLLVHEGEQVRSGERIATMGRGPDGKPELYFEIRENGDPVDPLRFLPKTR